MVVNQSSENRTQSCRSSALFEMLVLVPDLVIGVRWRWCEYEDMTSQGVPSIPSMRLVPEPESEEAEVALAARSPWTNPELGHRHRLGGEPSLLATPAPSCPGCGVEMTFYGQLDSINDEICLADAGVCTVWICFDCYEAVARIEST